jgi:DNA-binding LytR/AlgR family response regulator
MKSMPEPRPQIILITSSRENAKEAFDFDVTDFILKPITHERFLKAVSKAKKLARKKINNAVDQDIFIRTGSLMIKVNTRNLLYVEALSDYVIVHTTDQEKYTVHSTMKGIYDKLPSELYMRVHNSFIVRMDRIRNIDQNLLTLDDKLIPISRACKKPLMNRLNIV